MDLRKTIVKILKKTDRISTIDVILTKFNSFPKMIVQVPLDVKQENWLRDQELLEPKEQILEYSKAGEGNMNVVIRVKTTHKSFILKQSRPFVNKYPQIPAPKERILTERAFYKAIANDEILSSYSPKMIKFNEEFLVMVLDDLGNTADFNFIYREPHLFSSKDAESLISYLNSLHGLDAGDFPDNSGMKLLNHEHIFVFPYLEDNGFDLNQVQKGLQEIARIYKKNEALKKKIFALGERYLRKGNELLHGDFYPGSWMKVSGGIKVIDSEFAFLGDREFDLGVMLAHLKLAKVSQLLINEIQNLYKRNAQIDQILLNQYMGAEILRRLIGLAQLPLHLSLEDKKQFCEEATSLIL
jgi:5-methylthioribose kinase